MSICGLSQASTTATRGYRSVRHGIGSGQRHSRSVDPGFADRGCRIPPRAQRPANDRDLWSATEDSHARHHREDFDRIIHLGRPTERQRKPRTSSDRSGQIEQFIQDLAYTVTWIWAQAIPNHHTRRCSLSGKSCTSSRHSTNNLRHTTHNLCRIGCDGLRVREILDRRDHLGLGVPVCWLPWWLPIRRP